MFAQLTSGLDFHAKALVLRAERQRVIASNIANADTPGYVARDVDFKTAMTEAIGSSAQGGQSALTLQANLPGRSSKANLGHLALKSRLSEIDDSPLAYTVQTQPSADSNSVDLDRERANFVDNAVRYESTLRFINGHSKTILSAIQGQ
jgi:flagellar basal-body rod protein FlgB